MKLLSLSSETNLKIIIDGLSLLESNLGVIIWRSHLLPRIRVMVDLKIIE